MDAEPGRDALVVMEHQLPEMEIQQEITDINQISRIPQNRMERDDEWFFNKNRVGVTFLRIFVSCHDLDRKM